MPVRNEKKKKEKKNLQYICSDLRSTFEIGERTSAALGSKRRRDNFA